MENYAPDRESSYINYLDTNNLYGWAMSKPLPYRNFRWVEPKYFGDNKKQQTGHIYEVDFEYPDELHDLRNDYPCAAEKKNVTDEMLSHYCLDIKNRFKINNGNVYKLIPTLYNKEKYVLHEKNLELYSSLGLKLK